MPWDPIFDIAAAMERLRPVIEQRHPRTGADFAAALPEFMALPRYQEADGPDRLLRELEEAIDASLPLDPEIAVQDRDWARLILGFDQPEQSITSRRRDLAERSGSAKKYRDRFVVQSALHLLQLTALEAPPGHSQFDCGFEVQSIAVRIVARTRYALNVRHEVRLKLRAARGGQRLVPLCYGGAIAFASVSASVLPEEAPTVVTCLGTTLAVTGDPQFPTHFFWLSDPPVPGATITVCVNLDELHRRSWTEIDSRLRLITSDMPKIRFSMQPRRSFRSVTGYRLAGGGTEPVQEFRTAGKTKGELPQYKPTARTVDDAFHLHFSASDKCITNQRRLIRASHISL